jgi:hypothetical protein
LHIALGFDIDPDGRVPLKHRQTTVQNAKDPLDASVVVEEVRLSVSCDHIESLGGFSLAGSAVNGGDRIQKPTTKLMTAGLQVVGVPHEGDESLQLGNDGVVAEEEPTVPKAVVSRAAHRVPVHDPHEDRLILPLCVSSGGRKIGSPRDREPLHFQRRWQESVDLALQVGLSQSRERHHHRHDVIMERLNRGVMLQ